MPVVPGASRDVASRGDGLPTLQRLVDRDAGSTTMTVLVNTFSGEQRVPEHVHDVEEVLLVRQGRCTFSLGDDSMVAISGDAIIVPPGTRHSIMHFGDEPATVVAVLASPDVHVPTFPTPSFDTP